MILHAVLLATLIEFEPPLPMPLPNFPPAPTEAGATLTLATPSNSTGYSSETTSQFSLINSLITPVEDLIDAVHAFFDDTDMPEANNTSHDLNTGLDPTGEGAVTSAGLFTDLGESVGTVFSYIRLLLTLPYGFFPDSPILNILSIAARVIVWLIVLNIFIFFVKIILLIIKWSNPLLQIALALIKKI